MKKYLFVFALFVAALGLTSCSSNDDNTVVVPQQQDNNGVDVSQKGDSIELYGKSILYSPQDFSSLPEWMTQYITTPAGEKLPHCFVCKGETDGRVFYNVYNLFSSSAFGWFYDKDGNYIERPEDSMLQEKISVCIYYNQ